MRRPLQVGLVACARRKAHEPRPARDLYRSPLFQAAAAYAATHSDRWFILSALHGLVEPETVLAPYELSLRRLDATARRAWGERIARELNERLPAGSVLWFHAGALYRAPIAAVVTHRVRVPLMGLGIGEQLHWYRQRSGGRASEGPQRVE